MPAPSRASASKPRRIPLLIVLAFVTAGVAFITRNHGGILGMFASSSPPSAPDIPSWMKQPFDKQQPLTHTVHSYAEPAHSCCKNGSTKCLKELLTAHGPGVVDALNADGVSPLQVSSELGNIKVINWLLSHNASVDLAEPRVGFTPLRLAAARGHLDACEALLAAGALVDKADSIGVSQVYTTHAGCSRESLSCSSSTGLLPICIEQPHLPSSGTHCESTFRINHDISKAQSLLYNSKASLLLKDSLLHKTAQELAQMKGRYSSAFSIRMSNATRHSHLYVGH